MTHSQNKNIQTETPANPAVQEMNREQSKVFDHDNRKETTFPTPQPHVEPGEQNPHVGEEDTRDPGKVDPTRQDERDNDHTRIKPGVTDPTKKDPTRIQEP